MSTIETYPGSQCGAELLSDDLIELWNEEFPALTPAERIEVAYRRLGNCLIVASSFGPTAPVLLNAVNDGAPDLTVTTVRTHHETLETLRLVDWYTEELGLNLDRHEAPVRPIPPANSPAFVEFQQDVKVKPFQQILEEHKALAYLSGQMRWQLPGRAERPFVERKGAVVAINAVVDVTEEAVEAFFTETGYPRDPHYFDPTKGPDQKTECGLNTTNYELHRDEE